MARTLVGTESTCVTVLQAALHMHVSDIEELPKDGSRAWLLVQFGADSEEEPVGGRRSSPAGLSPAKGYDEGGSW